MIRGYAYLLAAGLIGLAVVLLTAYVVHLKSTASSANKRAASAEVATEAHKAAATSWEIDGLQARLDLSQCQSQWAETQVAAADMVADAKARAAKAEADARAWKSRWNEKSAVCTSALETLNSACAELGDY